MKKNLIIVTLILAVSLLFTACRKLDVIGNGSITSFKEVLNAIPNNISADATNGGWALTAPDGSARFIWSKDFSQRPIYDVMLEFDAQPFIAAGLDPNRLPDGMAYDDKIMVGTKLENERSAIVGEATPLTAFEQIVKLNRERIKYHADLDHYGVDLGDGNMFEWAKDMRTNDKDIVFVLDPQVFLEAGVNPSQVAGWIFAKVKTMDSKGKPIEIDKFLKPFDLDLLQ